MDSVSDSIAGAALFLSIIAIISQAITAYRRRRRIILEIHTSSFYEPPSPGRPERRENWIQIRASALGGTFSTAELTVELDGVSGGFNMGSPDLGRNIPDQDQRTIGDRLADPVHVRRTVLEGESTAWVFRLTGGPDDGAQNVGSWVRAKLTLTGGRVIRSRWTWVWPDDPSKAQSISMPPKPKEVSGRSRRK